ncbi:guanylate-binding protein 1-like [Rissa tridactyla]|uniref:guanylate-binding protein 1-like n=1 Tax=Rissa tridactyla TaxID=75485 RepID=UPI0023BA59C4|nr:guanylate-binding protein 1-like [Rissa tridactyla]XP_054039477.1 guanylate-binding protein 1-like [Rissa tridactyla]XP_054039478.1 guanylate-binding protein 1-like [Rissa tridactyla]XP_054039479.1 guanylate-binding protein 1-like [Rissa tridactyla]XP_054039480.1 guanylate-binding protein 1-like [Rissa tridactyla]
MASEIHMPEPVCLIENTRTKGLVVQQEALQVLSGITQPVVVVAITGLYRTGKSYLMNRLACQRKGFSLGSGVQSHTRGIWMWCVPHPCKPGHTLVLLDTEGLGDVEKGDTENDTWIFVLTVLLSSTLIYNSKGTIDQQAVDQLHCVMKLTEQVKLKAAPEQSEDELEDSEKSALFFPTFVWTVRDFTLQLEVDGKEISEDEYLENALKLKAGSSPETQCYNQPRECICQFFRDRKCFVFYQPTHRRDLVRLEELPDDEIDCEFRQQVEKFCSHIWEKSPPKTIPCGRTITGTLLGKLAESYVETIRSGAVPCPVNAVLALAKTVNAAAVKEAVTLYQDLMERRVKLPTETVQELLDLHTQCERETLDLFQKQAFQEEICSFLADLTCQVEAIKDKFCRDNEQASREKCEAALRDLFQDLDRKITDGVYNVPGGHQLFEGDRQALLEKYGELPGKGVMADAVLQEFLQRREALDKILELTLAEKDKELKGAQERYERAQQEWDARWKQEAEDKQKLQDKLHSTEEEVARLRKKLEDQPKKRREEHPKTSKRKSKEESGCSSGGSGWSGGSCGSGGPGGSGHGNNNSNWENFVMPALLVAACVAFVVFRVKLL